MPTKIFKKIIKEVDPDKLLEKYMIGELYFTDKQLEILTGLGSHHGGANKNYGKICDKKSRY